MSSPSPPPLAPPNPAPERAPEMVPELASDRRARTITGQRLEGGLVLIFVLLGVVLSSLLSAHWLLVVEPLLREDAASRSRALAAAEGRNLAALFDPDTMAPAALRAELEAALSGILLLRDPATDTPFVRRIELVIDYDQVPVPPGSLDISAGSPSCDGCFIAEIPLFRPDDDQLVGLATFGSSPDFLRQLVGSVRVRLVGIGAASLLLIALAGLGAWQLLRRLRSVEAELRRAALTDVLTGLPNRRALYQRLAVDVERAHRYPNQPLCIALLDLDHFKAVNDRFGHAIGDEVLMRVAASIQGSIRGSDMVGRHGGEELLLILPNTDLPAAREATDRARRAVAALRFSEPALRITVSGGLSQASADADIDALVEAADRNLYAAKAGGRDRIVG